VDEGAAPHFGAFLRKHRLRAGISQEDLAGRAGVSKETVSSLERGITLWPYRDSVQRLIAPLNLTPAEKAQMEAAAERPGRPRGDQRKNVPDPAALSSDTPRDNLPLPLTRLIGRDDIVATVISMARDHRLVTLMGTGGVGKTRLALRAAELLQPEFADGVRFVELTSIGDPTLLAGAVAASVGAREPGDRPIDEILIATLRRRRLLLVLDTCEHLIGAVTALARTVLEGCPEIVILATSRERLKIPAEHVFEVAPLEYPDEGTRPGAERAAEFGAVVLFVERANAISPFTLTDENASLVVEVCRRLDGIPLAIELAAARLRVVGLEELTRRLDQRLALLSGGQRSPDRRHETLRAVIEWSYELLSEAERTLFRRLAIFVGGWSTTAVESVCQDEPLSRAVVLNVLSELIDKSQVVVNETDTGTRCRLLDSIREYALEQLVASGELQAVARRHAEWMAWFAEQAATSVWSLPRRQWLLAMMPEADNARAALSWALGAGHAPELASRIVPALGGYLYYRGLAGEGKRLTEAVLDRLGEGADDETAGILWLSLSSLAAGTGRVAAANEAIRHLERAGDKRRLATAYMNLALAYRQTRRPADAEAAIDETLALLRESGERGSTYYASALCSKAAVMVGSERYDEARALFEEGISRYEDLGDRDRSAVERLNYAELEFANGDIRRAIDLIETALEQLRSVPVGADMSNELAQVVPRLNLAACQLVVGNVEEARAAATAATDLACDGRYPLHMAIAVQHLATVAALKGDPARAARLLGFVNSVYGVEGVDREPTEARLFGVLSDALRSSLDDRRLSNLLEQGALLREEEAIAVALQR